MRPEDLHSEEQPMRERFQTEASKQMAFVDGHVHIHDVFDVAAMLDHASQNRDSEARRQGLSPAVPGVLMLTESQGTDGFQRIAEEDGQRLGRWRVLRTGEPMSLRLETENAAPLLLIAGRQIVTAERLEVLALGTLATFVDGLTIGTVLDQVADADALPVLPWGFGKWIGGRGRLVGGLLESPRASRLFVGDNGSRLGIAPEPSLFRIARQHGVPILPGTDPFPFAAQVGQPLSYGFVLAADVTGNAPAASVQQTLQVRRAQPEIFGRCAGMVGFVRNQLAMQWRKRRATAGAAA
ncbi:hypothetical protein [Thioalkalivibrio sp.]|uniref:hypothetical protein n=1 Tax=Thioalkalivibrio sp. TaxID=2093813 RepID=UPI003569DDF0